VFADQPQVHVQCPLSKNHHRNPDNINNELLPSNPDAHTHVKLFRPSIQVAMFWHGEGSHSFMLISHIFPTMKGKLKKIKIKQFMVLKNETL